MAALMLAIAAGQGYSADRPGKTIRESASLPVDKNVQKRFGTIRDYLAEKRWLEAIDVLQEIAQTDGRLLVRPQNDTPSETAVYFNIAAYCNIELSKLPPEGLSVYRRRVDTQAQRWFEQWKATHDDSHLHRILREAYLSSHGDDALWALGESAWDRGDFASARLYWTQLVPLGQEARTANLPTVLRYPDSNLNPADVLARLVLCTIMDGKRDYARVELEEFKRLCPDATGTLAGRTGPLSELLAQAIDESARWEFSVGGQVNTFAMNSQRNGRAQEALDIGAAKWNHSLPANRFPHLERMATSPDRGPLCYHAVTHQDYVFVNSARSIWAWNIVTGEPAWPTEWGTGEIYPPVPEESLPANVEPQAGRNGRPVGPRSQATTGLPTQISSGIPCYTMTVADGRLYARMGSPVTNVTENIGADDTLESDLVCLDLAHGQGRLIWKIASRELIREEHKPWRFEGSPVVMDGRAYVALSRRRPQFEFAIACLDAASGSLLWHRPVVSGRGTVEDHHNRISHLLLTAGAGKLYLSTDVGAIVAVSARDGRLDWGVTYESIQRSQQRMFELSSQQHQGMLPAVFHDGLVFVAPNDSSRLFCIEADSGRVKWQIPQPEPYRWRHFLGVVPGGDAGRLLVGGNVLTAIDIATKKVVYGSDQRVPPAEQGFGRGVIAGDVVLWPTSEDIRVIDAATGVPIANKPLHSAGNAELGGNLTVAQGMLLVAQPERLVAYCDYSLIKQRLDKSISERSSQKTVSGPELARELGQRADLELAEGRLHSAIQDLRRAIEIDHSSASNSRYRARLLDVVWKQGRNAKGQGQNAEAAKSLAEAVTLASEAKDLSALRMELAEVELLNSGPAAAISVWQQNLDDPACRDLPHQGSTVGALATTAITRLIRDAGRPAYTDVEQRAEAAIGACLAANDRDRLAAALKQYPHSQAAARAWRELATNQKRAGDLEGALATLSRRVITAVEPQDEALATIERAATLQTAGFWRAAGRAWQQLSDSRLASCEVTIENKTQRVRDVALQELSQLNYKAIEPTESSAPHYLNRAWAMPLPDANGRLVALIPGEDPPAHSLSCVLVHRSNAPELCWDCLDRATGKIRWSRDLPAIPQWSAYSDSHLLVATENELLALSLESGRELWMTPLAANRQSTPEQLGVTPTTTRIRCRDGVVIVFNPRTGLSFFDGRTGEKTASFYPPRGKLMPQWIVGESRIALQTQSPTVTWFVDAAGIGKVANSPSLGEPWLHGTVDGPAGTMTTVNGDFRVACYSVFTGRTRWDYQGGLSYAHAHPVLWQSGKQMLLTVDGTTLVGLSGANGQAEWSAGIADRPLVNPAQQVVAQGGAAFAASHGLLRRVSLMTGECEWERYLGSAAEQWRVTPSRALLAAWPIGNPPGASTPNPQAIVWCDLTTGQILQRMFVDQAETVDTVHCDPLGWLILTDRRVLALTSAQQPLAATGGTTTRATVD
jgi:outer membrane protein assembly factor BamB